MTPANWFLVVAFASVVFVVLIMAGCGTNMCRCDRAYPGDPKASLQCQIALGSGGELP